MRLFHKLLILTLALSLAACSRGESYDNAEASANSAGLAQQAQGGGGGARAAANEAAADSLVSYVKAGDSAEQAPTVVLPERKIIRNAELTLELDVPAEAQRKLTSIAESHGGFVVTAEARQREGGAQPVVAVEMRVPSQKFDAALGEIRALGGRVRHEKTSGRDVTEEYIDLEARLRTQRALEAQFLEIMKRAQKVSEALEVQTQLAQVRGEIERVEGRRRFLENQSALSTIRVTLQTPAPLVSAETSGFAAGLRRAFGDGLDVAAGIVLALVRVGIALVPVVLLLGLPLVLLWRLLRRARARGAQTAAGEEPRPAGA